MGVKIQCKICNGFADSDQFKLHHEFKKMVCPTCYSGKNKKEAEKKPEAVLTPLVPPKPAGWDHEDEYLEKMIRYKKQETPPVQFQKIEGSEHIKCKCMKCKFSFKYDPIRKVPRTCPYCNMNIPQTRAFNSF